jgi:hypothetical protein
VLFAFTIENVTAQGGVIFFDFHTPGIIALIFLSVINVIALCADQANPATVSLFLCHFSLSKMLVKFILPKIRGHVNTGIGVNEASKKRMLAYQTLHDTMWANAN